MSVMPKTRRLIGRAGTTFDRNVVNYPLCCPSRATFLTGQYAHNHGVLWNNWPWAATGMLDGSETLPVWLGRAGYRTIHIGKYLNEYGEEDPTEVPKGWDDWYGGVDPSTYDYYGMTINHNGELKTYPRSRATTRPNVYTRLADHAIGDASQVGQAVLPEPGAERAAHGRGRVGGDDGGLAGAAAAAVRGTSSPTSRCRSTRTSTRPTSPTSRPRSPQYFPTQMTERADPRSCRTTGAAGWARCSASTTWSRTSSRSCSAPASSRTR